MSMLTFRFGPNLDGILGQISGKQGLIMG